MTKIIIKSVKSEHPYKLQNVFISEEFVLFVHWLERISSKLLDEGKYIHDCDRKQQSHRGYQEHSS